MSGLLVFICISQVVQADAANHEEKSVRTIVLEAQQLQQKVAGLGFEWTTIEPLIRSAHLHIERGELKLAVMKAEEAIMHAKLGLLQAKDAQQQWQHELPPKQ